MKTRLIFHIVIFTLLSHHSYAITPAERALQQQEQILQQQQKSLEQQFQLPKEKYLKEELERYQEKQKKKQLQKNKDTSCIPIKNISFSGNSLFTDEQLRKSIAGDANGCLGDEAFDRMLRSIEHYYSDRGYILTQVEMVYKLEDLLKGNMHIIVNEVRIDDITMNENKPLDQRQINMAFPNLIGKVINIRPLEQGRDQMNRLYSNDIKMSIHPADKLGYTQIKVKNEAKEKNHLQLQWDNAGQKTTGKHQANILYERDNLFYLNDQWKFRAGRTLGTNRGERFSENIALTGSLPYGNWRFAGQVAHSKYRNQVTGFGLPLEAEGRTKLMRVGTNYMVFRNQKTKFGFGGTLTLKDTDSKLASIKSETGSRNLTLAEARAEITHIAAGGVINTKLSLQRGTKFLWATNDADSLTKQDPRAQFTKFQGDVTAYRPFSIAHIPLAYFGTITAQHSPQTLYGSERIAIGDRYTVRGFQEEGIQGDTGVYMRNEVSYLISKWTDSAMFEDIVGKLKLYSFLDLGKVQARGGRSANFGEGAGELSGTGFGIKNNGKYLRFDVTYAKPIYAPDFIEKENQEVYATLGVGWRW